MPELLTDLFRLLSNLWDILYALLQLAFVLLPALLWCAWWLFCVNWKKAWLVLAAGGWVPVVLLMAIVALAWSRISGAPCNCLGFTIANFYWQSLAVIGLTLLALFCGWAQGRLDWTPAEVSFDPPPEHGHDHGQHHDGGHH
jgi:hypothetical protein